MASANLVIIQLLHAQTNQAEFLRICWEKLTKEQKRQVFHYLYLSGQHKTFLSALRMEINTEDPLLPWTHLFAVLHAANKINMDIVRAFVNSHACKDEIGRFRIEHPELLRLWQETKQNKFKKFEEKKKELLSSLDFARQQGFKDQRHKIIDELKMNYPSDPEILKALESEREYLARSTIHKVFQKKLAQNDWFPTVSDIDPEIAKKIFKSSKKYLKKKPQMALDVAIMYYQMEMYSEALLIIDTITEKTAHVLWYTLQISIDGKQFARALSIIDVLRNKKLTSDHSFSLMYYQAIALFGLGQRSEAKLIIANIVKIRPDFRSADSLLMEWENEK
jgi:tetratricopeptide (TPR) repeat protein